VPVLEHSLIDFSAVTVDDAILSGVITFAWMGFRLRSEGWFILRLQQGGDHKIEFPE
jgi:hypothetical protein